MLYSHKQQSHNEPAGAEVGKVQLTEPTLGKRDKDPFGHKSSLLAGTTTTTGLVKQGYLAASSNRNLILSDDGQGGGRGGGTTSNLHKMRQ